MGGKREPEDDDPTSNSDLDSEEEGEENGEENGETKTKSPVAKKAKIETQKGDENVGSDDKVENDSKEKSEKQETPKPPAPKPPAEAHVRHETLSQNALVIFGLHPLITKEEMQEVMSKYGKVERLETRKAFASTYCFCDYETEEETRVAIEKLNGTSLKGKELIVKLANDNKTKSKPYSAG
jgi:RNA recognition motif-containing protein